MAIAILTLVLVYIIAGVLRWRTLYRRIRPLDGHYRAAAREQHWYPMGGRA